jgi:hypothetical protein
MLYLSFRALPIPTRQEREELVLQAASRYAAGDIARVVKWQTRRTQNPLASRPCGFESHPGHHQHERRAEN